MPNALAPSAGPGPPPVDPFGLTLVLIFDCAARLIAGSNFQLLLSVVCYSCAQPETTFLLLPQIEKKIERKIILNRKMISIRIDSTFGSNMKLISREQAGNKNSIERGGR